jgi:hypothetical protein
MDISSDTVFQKFSVRKVATRIAVGLVEQQEQITVGASLPVTSPNINLKKGIEQLATLCVANQVMPPKHHKEIVEWLHRPLEEWVEPLGSLMEEIGLTEPLLQFGIPTDTAFALAERVNQGHDTDLEIQDLAFKEILSFCKTNQLDQQYIKARLSLVQSPYLERGAIEIRRDLEWHPTIRDLVCASYEKIPPKCRVPKDGREYITLCPRCGWVLNWEGTKRRRAVCYSSLCCQLEARINYTERWLPYRPEAMRTTRGIQASVVAPERLLLEMRGTLQSKGMTCELWPNVDAYDLRVHLKGELWAVDLKDHAFPVELARDLKPFKDSPRWDKAFYLLPDHRNTLNYNRKFQPIWRERHHQEPDLAKIDVLFVQQFIRKIDETLK